jgi:hypothetical protein
MNTLERLKLKAESSFNKARMPSIKQISKLLDEYGINHDVYEKTNVVEYRSKGRRYVNSRHYGKTGFCLTIKEPYLELDTSDSYYSWNTSGYARRLLEIIDSRTA